MHSVENSFKQGFKDCMPTLLGYVGIGFAFGVVGISSSLSFVEVSLLSVLVYAGAAQFIFCGLWLAGAPFSSIILTVFIINLRHLLMAFSIAPAFTNQSTLRNIGFGTFLTDETYSVAMLKKAQMRSLPPKWMDSLNLTAYVSWLLATMLGALVGKWIPNPASFGLDYALTAMFIALLVANLQTIHRTKIAHYIRLIIYVAIFMYVALLFFKSYIAILICTMVVAMIGVLTEK